jgi:hypothetical protein
MTTERAKQIRSVWDSIEEGEPEISTERLIEMTATKCKCDTDDVVEALAITEAQ